MKKVLGDIRHFFWLSRPVNVLISVLAFALACFLANERSPLFFFSGAFWAVALLIAGIAAGGYWINDVFDFRIDRINRPQKTIVNAFLSVKKVITVYVVFTFLLLFFSAAVMGWYYRQFEITFINFLSVFLLLWYASHLKRIGVPGNLTIAFLIALVVVLAGYLFRINMALVWMTVFSFEITLIREITKDVEDIRGDLNFSLQTLPIQIGIRKTKLILRVLYVLFLISCYLPPIYRLVLHGEMLWVYLWVNIGLVQAPAIFILAYMERSANPADFGVQSRYLKFLMLSGMLTLVWL